VIALLSAESIFSLCNNLQSAEACSEIQGIFLRNEICSQPTVSNDNVGSTFTSFLSKEKLNES